VHGPRSISEGGRAAALLRGPSRAARVMLAGRRPGSSVPERWPGRVQPERVDGGAGLEAHRPDLDAAKRTVRRVPGRTSLSRDAKPVHRHPQPEDEERGGSPSFTFMPEGRPAVAPGVFPRPLRSTFAGGTMAGGPQATTTRGACPPRGWSAGSEACQDRTFGRRRRPVRRARRFGIVGQLGGASAAWTGADDRQSMAVLQARRRRRGDVSSIRRRSTGRGAAATGSWVRFARGQPGAGFFLASKIPPKNRECRAPPRVPGSVNAFPEGHNRVGGGRNPPTGPGLDFRWTSCNSTSGRNDWADEGRLAKAGSAEAQARRSGPVQSGSASTEGTGRTSCGRSGPAGSIPSRFV